MITRFLSSLLFIATVNTGIVRAQVVPDGTLPTVVEQLENMRKITGGERVGNNLFHSFEEFSIPEGIEAIFENGLDIENIFTRITGSDISVIDGLLKTAGGANFFLINPNGIVFGENAQLDVGGSFIATTANRIEFADGTNWHILGGEPKVTLTISVPIGLGLDGNNGSITVNGTGNQISSSSRIAPLNFTERPTDLSVNNGNTLALIGNGINFNGGVVTTEGGNIYLNSVESGSVTMSLAENRLTFLDDGVTKYQDITLLQESLIDGSGEKVGTISLIGKNINLSDATFILAQNQGSLPGGSVNLRASESIELLGNSLDGSNPSGIRSEAVNLGVGSDVNISTRQLVLSQPSMILANTFGDASGGNIKIEALDKIELAENQSNSSFALINAGTFSAGNAGSIKLSTRQLRIIDGGSLSSSTVGSGNAGNITVNADSIELIGTKKLEVVEQPTQSNIITGSVNAGDAGNITVNTSKLKITDGAAIDSSSLATGNAGTITINASDSIEVSGVDSLGFFPSIITSSVDENRQAIFGIPSPPTGLAGDVNLNTPLLNISQGGVVSVINQGTGNAGRVNINADTLNLDEAASITAAASSGIGGNIELNTQDLNISNDSQITATVGSDGDGGNITINTTNLTAKKNARITASADSGDGGNIILNADSVSLNEQDEISAASTSGDGGNININTDILTALEQSKITANAVTGDGGNITINTRGYFVSEDSVVSASSQFGQTGTININSPENNFQQYLEDSEVEIAIIPDFFIPRCANPDRAYLTLFPGDVLRESPDNYYSYPSQTDTDVVLEEPEYQEKLDRIVQRYLERLEPEIEEPEPEIEIEPKSGLIWQPGDPMINATEIVETEDGEVFLVPPEQKQEFLQELRCGQSVN
ncbi:MAG: filamentous hemagglutinin N-terminal domain-containing protein [Xenococcaceae cyanobacterium]